MSPGKWRPFRLCLNVLSIGSIYIWDPSLVISLPADDPAPNSARPSAATVLAERLGMLSHVNG